MSQLASYHFISGFEKLKKIITLTRHQLISRFTLVLQQTVDPSDTSNIVLALRTLAMFRFTHSTGGKSHQMPPHSLMMFAKECSSMKYLRHNRLEVRLEAVVTVTALIRHSIPLPCVTDNNTMVIVCLLMLS